jgi:hypothetical protein
VRVSFYFILSKPVGCEARARELLVATGQATGAIADFDFKPGYNLVRFGQLNIEPNSRFTAQSMALSRAKRIGAGDLIQRSGRRYPQQCLLQFASTQSVQEARTDVRNKTRMQKA